MKKRFTEEQIIGILREADAAVKVKDLCRRHGFSEAKLLPVAEHPEFHARIYGRCDCRVAAPSLGVLPQRFARKASAGLSSRLFLRRCRSLTQ